MLEKGMVTQNPIGPGQLVWREKDQDLPAVTQNAMLIGGFPVPYQPSWRGPALISVETEDSFVLRYEGEEFFLRKQDVETLYVMS